MSRGGRVVWTLLCALEFSRRAGVVDEGITSAVGPGTTSGPASEITSGVGSGTGGGGGGVGGGIMFRSGAPGIVGRYTIGLGGGGLVG